MKLKRTTPQQRIDNFKPYVLHRTVPLSDFIVIQNPRLAWLRDGSW